MKLNHDCIRDLLLYLEDHLCYKDEIRINSLKIEPYSQDELLYTADRLIEAGYLNSRFGWNMQSSHIITVNSISYDGHQFLDTIRDDGIWKNTKNKFAKFSSISLPIIQELASSLIKSQLGLS